MTDPCPFCLENNLLRTSVLLQGKYWFITDLNEGSITNATMAISVRHIETPFEIDENEWSELRMILQDMKRLVDSKDMPDGYSIGWNVNKAGGQNVPHVHLHMMGRYDDEPMAGKGIRYAFKGDANRRPPH